MKLGGNLIHFQAYQLCLRCSIRTHAGNINQLENTIGIGAIHFFESFFECHHLTTTGKYHCGNLLVDDQIIRFFTLRKFGSHIDVSIDALHINVQLLESFDEDRNRLRFFQIHEGRRESGNAASLAEATSL